MMNVFEKIREKFANIHRVVTCDEDLEWNRAVYECETLVNQVEQEHNNGWIACSEKEPNVVGNYLITDWKGDIRVERYCGSSWFAGFGYVISWQPLPQPYKERDTNGN